MGDDAAGMEGRGREGRLARQTCRPGAISSCPKVRRRLLPSFLVEPDTAAAQQQQGGRGRSARLRSHHGGSPRKQHHQQRRSALSPHHVKVYLRQWTSPHAIHGERAWTAVTLADRKGSAQYPGAEQGNDRKQFYASRPHCQWRVVPGAQSPRCSEIVQAFMASSPLFGFDAWHCRRCCCRCRCLCHCCC